MTIPSPLELIEQINLSGEYMKAIGALIGWFFLGMILGTLILIYRRR